MQVNIYEGIKMDNVMTLTQLPQGTKALIVSIQGGHGLIRKLNALGIREGVEIQKISTGIARGPVVIRCGNTEAAIGHGMAQKVFVKKK
ncbi:MAG: ferrous iron transport protein A [Spirochaetales bacterium]|nr:ferrous iron transport protein A [Spirochaetales bacterium]